MSIDKKRKTGRQTRGLGDTVAVSDRAPHEKQEVAVGGGGKGKPARWKLPRSLASLSRGSIKSPDAGRPRAFQHSSVRLRRQYSSSGIRGISGINGEER